MLRDLNFIQVGGTHDGYKRCLVEESWTRRFVYRKGIMAKMAVLVCGKKQHSSTFTFKVKYAHCCSVVTFALNTWL